MFAVLALAAATPTARIEADFFRCAGTYRAGITGRGTAARPFDCAERVARARSATTTLAIVEAFAMAAQAGRRWLDLLARDAARIDPKAFPPQRLSALAEARAKYRQALCRSYGSLTGGTIDRSNAAICEARDVDAQIGDLFALLKEAGVIPNGR